MDIEKKIEEIIKKHTLLNALEFGKANEKAVIGKIFAELPEAKIKAKEVIETVRKIVTEINSLSPERIKSLCEELGIEKEVKKVKKERILPEIPVEGKPVFRIAPNPNGPLHIGHARMVVLNDEYAKKYNGKLILRFDDTDPKNPAKRPVKEAYDMIREDLKWLGIVWHEEIIASQRLDIYYEWFEKCLEKEIAYICTCDADEWRKLVREERKACRCRSRDVKENLKLWKKMLSHGLKEGEAVGRIKTSLEESDPAIIDWVAFRIVDNPEHPLYPRNPPKVWPTLDFASAIDDKLCGVTHILRGKDLAVCEKRQRVLYKALGWKYPKVFVFGKIFSEKFVFSTSKIREEIEKGNFSGFDDPRLPTLRAFRRRGITSEAIRNYIISLGLSEVETTFDPKILYAENRKIIDPRAKRFFFVLEPVKIELDDLPFDEVKAPLYPDKSRYREIKVGTNLFVEKEDFEKFKGEEVRLMHFCNVILDKKSKVTGTENKDIPKIHWVSESFSVKAELVFPEKRVYGIAEKNVENLKENELVQFERVGFARCDEKLIFFFAHK